MGLQERNQLLSTHFSSSLSLSLFFFIVFLRSFKLDAAIRGANVIYYTELRMENRNTIELRVRVQKQYGTAP
jgi:hypothetical protein